MKTPITIKSDKKNISNVIALFVCLAFSLNTLGQQVNSTLIETWSIDNWANFMLVTNTYSDSRLTKTLTQSWTTATSSWKNTSQSNYTYNTNGNINQIIIQSWNNNSSEWINSQRITFSYNASNKLLTNIIETWMISNWQNTSKTINTYDESDYLTNSISQTWISFSSTWQNSTQHR